LCLVFWYVDVLLLVWFCANIPCQGIYFVWRVDRSRRNHYYGRYAV
jgi:hypothetical protein